MSARSRPFRGGRASVSVQRRPLLRLPGDEQRNVPISFFAIGRGLYIKGYQNTDPVSIRSPAGWTGMEMGILTRGCQSRTRPS